SCFAICILAGSALFAQHEKTGEKSRHPAIGDPKAIEAGKKIFAAGCAACHGADGRGGRGPSLREAVFWHPVDDDTLYKAIQKGIPGGMPAANLPENDAWQVVAFVRALTSPAAETPLASGDASAGEALFWGKAGCATCHRIRGRGGALGPDLTNIGGSRALPQLRDAIVDPDAEGAGKYRSADVLLKNGKRIRGVARNFTNYSLQLQDAAGELHLIAMTDVSELDLSKTSPMPKNFKQRLTSAEIDNIVSYLSQQTIRPVTPGAKREEK
ncbi:MAG: c-type cytochrome, partial [Phycisphaerales bacterium]|nr:c-type cytochrome [Phycisphaerales bacterium]